MEEIKREESNNNIIDDFSGMIGKFAEATLPDKVVTIRYPGSIDLTKKLVIKARCGVVEIFDEEVPIMCIVEPKYLGDGWVTPGYMGYMINAPNIFKVSDTKINNHIVKMRQLFSDIYGHEAETDLVVYQRMYGQSGALVLLMYEQFNTLIQHSGGIGDMPDFGHLSKHSIEFYSYRLLRLFPKLDKDFVKELMIIPDSISDSEDSNSDFPFILDMEVYTQLRRCIYAVLMNSSYGSILTKNIKKQICHPDIGKITFLESMPNDIHDRVRTMLGIYS